MIILNLMITIEVFVLLDSDLSMNAFDNTDVDGVRDFIPVTRPVGRLAIGQSI